MAFRLDRKIVDSEWFHTYENHLSHFQQSIDVETFVIQFKRFITTGSILLPSQNHFQSPFRTLHAIFSSKEIRTIGRLVWLRLLDSKVDEPMKVTKFETSPESTSSIIVKSLCFMNLEFFLRNFHHPHPVLYASFYNYAKTTDQYKIYYCSCF
jgi:hypothetical protein